MERTSASVNSDERMKALQAVLREAVEMPQVSPAKGNCTAQCSTRILKPAMTQEQAAEALDVPFSTYRRHLKAGMIRVVDLLWQKEIGASGR